MGSGGWPPNADAIPEGVAKVAVAPQIVNEKADVAAARPAAAGELAVSGAVVE